MKAVVTRVLESSVMIDGRIVGQISRGFLVLLGIAPQDTKKDAVYLADRVCGVRVFQDEDGKMNWNLEKAGGEILVVSQFTLFADLKSRRPGFSNAAKPDIAVPLYEKFIEECKSRGFHVEHGEFGADMKVASVNDGPVTLLFDTEA
ncbi:MAG: D-aminoacyl-tRNA deacylase [Lachnoclostridium sp.]|nr:D-aminoacyl-tRNA deacylase [Lachnospira sp.]MCM1249073.1 D-aminoacyl-tRNA deacylase [Lachnoclostridium sp.]MCM1535798.1 D-aminoacyl-tRNA deacylase [Clostridium sp.]